MAKGTTFRSYSRLCSPLFDTFAFFKCSGTYRSNALVGLVEGSHVSRVFVVLYNVLVVASAGNLLQGRCTSARGDCAGGSSGGKRQHGGNERVVGLITEIVFMISLPRDKGQNVDCFFVLMTQLPDMDVS
jgi:hypothetical protein